jgi:hypothetical protein
VAEIVGEHRRTKARRQRDAPLPAAQPSPCPFAAAVFCDDCAKPAGAPPISVNTMTNKDAAVGRATLARWRMYRTARSIMTMLQMYFFNLSSRDDGERRRVSNGEI